MSSVPFGGEFTAALTAAATSYLRRPGDAQQTAAVIASQVGSATLVWDDGSDSLRQCRPVPTARPEA